ncbi:MAG: SAM-dependent methyltransferase [Eubacteriaceae bacterium]|nr:SAM-dependent methyltransferase [Eubacteriaceae bacterium]
MENETIRFEPIGYITTGISRREALPRQGINGNLEGELILYERFAAGAADIKPGEEYFVLFYFNKSEGAALYVPKRGKGVFSTRSPERPNPIGLSRIKILYNKGGKIRFIGADMLEDTPILDIKPVMETEGPFA